MTLSNHSSTVITTAKTFFTIVGAATTAYVVTITCYKYIKRYRRHRKGQNHTITHGSEQSSADSHPHRLHAPDHSSSTDDGLRVDSIQVAIECFRKGIPVVVMDDEDRENEGDIVLPAKAATEEIIALMILHTSGILCAPMPEEVAQRLELPPMLTYNQDPKGTAFTVTTDCKGKGTTTGVSAYDRMVTFHTLADPTATAEALTRPGHVFPLRARRGGVLERRGHTEASVDLCRLAGIDPPVAVIGELTTPDGQMMRFQQCHAFARKHGFPIVTIEHLATYLVRNPLPCIAPSMSVTCLAECMLPINHGGVNCGLWKMRCYKHTAEKEHIALIYGNIDPSSRTLVRVHSECFTGDVLSSMRCDCGEQLHQSLLRIVENGHGIILYLTGHEGRGIGLVAKVRAYRLQMEQQMDTYLANLKLGYPEDMRSFDAAIAILKDIGVKRFSLLTNSPAKAAALVDHFEEVLEESLRCPHNEYSHQYLVDKRNRESRQRAGGIGSSFVQMTSALQLNALGSRVKKSIRIGIVRALWHNLYVNALCDKVKQQLNDIKCGSGEDLEVFEVVVPGVCSLPYGVAALAQSDVDAILCLGAVLSTDYPPPNFIGRVSALSAMGISFSSDIPVLYGVLACHDTQHLIDMTAEGSEVPLALALGTYRMATLFEREERPFSIPFNFVPAVQQDGESGGSECAADKKCYTDCAPPHKECFGVLEPYEDMRIAVLYAAWKEDEVLQVVDDLEHQLRELGVQNVERVRVPGMMELAREVYLSRQRGFDVALCVGVVTKAAMDHVYVNIMMEAATRMLSSLCESYAVECDTPTVNCIVTQDSNLTEMIPYWANSAVYLATMRQVRYPKLASQLSPRTPWTVAQKNPRIQGLRIAIVRSAWYVEAVDKLHANCVAQLKRLGVGEIIDIIVPGLFEMTATAHMLTKSDCHAILCLAVSIPDGTAHFEYATRASLEALLELQLASPTGLTLGVVPCKDIQTALTLCSDEGLAASLIDAVQFVCSGAVHHARLDKGVSLTAADIPPYLCKRGPTPDSPLLPPEPSQCSKLRIVIVSTLSCEVTLAPHRDLIIRKLQQLGVQNENIYVEYVPNVTELQFAVQRLRMCKVDLLLCLGAVIQDTFDTFRLICEGCMSQLQVESFEDIPVVCGVHLCQTVEQLQDCLRYAESFAPAAVHMAALRRFAIAKGLLTEGPTRPDPPLSPTVAPMSFTQVVMTPPSDQYLTRVALPTNRASTRIGIVSCAWLSDYQKAVVEVSKETLLEHGVLLQNVVELVVPMVSDLGLGAKLLLTRNPNLDAVVCVGVTVSGGVLTSCDHRASPAARGVELCQSEHRVPIISAVTATHSQRQASQRVAISNPWGRQVALTALHMVALAERYPFDEK